MNFKNIKVTDLNQDTGVFEEIAKEKLEKVNGGRWVSFTLEGVTWGEIWVY